MTDLLLLFIQ